MSTPNRTPAEDPPDPERLADEIATLASHLDAATHRLLSCIRSFDATEDWGRQGFISCAHWLVWRINLDPGAAREKVRVARALGVLPRIDEALRQGVLSYAKARALTRVATPENEERLLDCARYCTGAQLERLCRQLRKVDVFSKHGDRLDEHRFIKEECLESGLVRLTIVLHPDEAALVMKALEEARRAPEREAATSPRVPAETSTTPATSAPRVSAETSTPATSAPRVSAETSTPATSAPRVSAETSTPATSAPRVSAGARPALLPRPDALVRMAEAFLAQRDSLSRPGARAQVLVHLDQDPFAADQTLAATLDDGTRLSAEAFRRLSCDASLTPVRHDGSSVAGRGRRTVPPPLRRALWVRDRGCRFPGCTHHFFIHAHHVEHWAHGGPTTADNLVLLCTMHHRLVHEGGFGLKIDDAGEPVFTDQRGRRITSTWVAAPLDGAESIVTWNVDAGLDIDEQTAFPLHDGERIDYRWIVDLLAAREPVAS